MLQRPINHRDWVLSKSQTSFWLALASPRRRVREDNTIAIGRPGCKRPQAKNLQLSPADTYRSRRWRVRNNVWIFKIIIFALHC